MKTLSKYAIIERRKKVLLLSYKPDEFEKYLRFDRQLSIYTINHYLNVLRVFKKFLQNDLFNPKTLNDISREDITKFLTLLKEKNLAKSTMANYVYVLRSYYKWSAYHTNNETLSQVNMFLRDIVKIKKDNKLPLVPTLEDVIKLRNILKLYKEMQEFDKGMPSYKRTITAYTIIELLITTGMRSSELRNLRYKDIDLENRTVFIKMGKGGYQRMSLFGETAYQILKEYFITKTFEPDELLFPMKTNSLNYLLKRWALRAKINPQIHAHCFRHYYISEAQRQGVRLPVVAMQVGHRSLASTGKYTHFDISFLREQLSKINI